MQESQHIFKNLDAELKELKDRLEEKPKEIVVIERIVNSENKFLKQLIERVETEKVVQVHKKKDDSFVITSVPSNDSLIIFSLCINVILVVVLAAKIAGLW